MGVILDFLSDSVSGFKSIWVGIGFAIIVGVIAFFYYNQSLSVKQQKEYERFMQISKQHDLKVVLALNDSFLADDHKINLDEYKSLQRNFVLESDKKAAEMKK